MYFRISKIKFSLQAVTVIVVCHLESPTFLNFLNTDSKAFIFSTIEIIVIINSFQNPTQYSVIIFLQTAYDRANRLLNSTLTYSQCSNYSSLFTPLSLATSLWKKMGPVLQIPHLDYKVCFKGDQSTQWSFINV